MIRFVAVRPSGPLPDGFPVEVAWTDELGRSEQYLIRPATEWAEASWTIPGQQIGRRQDGLILEQRHDRRAATMELTDRFILALGSPVVLPCSERPAVDARMLTRLLRAQGTKRLTLPLEEADLVYRRACRPLLAMLPPHRHPGRSAETKRLRMVATRLLAKAKKAEYWQTGPHRGALADAEAMRRTWMAVRDGAVRLAARGVAR